MKWQAPHFLGDLLHLHKGTPVPAPFFTFTESWLFPRWDSRHLGLPVLHAWPISKCAPGGIIALYVSIQLRLTIMAVTKAAWPSATLERRVTITLVCSDWSVGLCYLFCKIYMLGFPQLLVTFSLPVLLSAAASPPALPSVVLVISVSFLHCLQQLGVHHHLSVLSH